MGWIICFYSSESDASTAIFGIWDGDEILFATDVADQATLLNSADFISEAAGNTIETSRSVEGDFQQRFTDYDVRLVQAQQTITLA